MSALRQLEESRREIEQRAADDIAAINAAAERAKDLEYRESQLVHQLDQARLRLKQAEDMHAAFTGRLTQLQNALLIIHSHPQSGAAGINKAAQVLDVYVSINTLKSAIADSPRIQSFLADQVATLQSKLDQFRKEHAID